MSKSGHCSRGRIRTADLRTNATLFNRLSCTASHFLIIYCLLPSTKLCEAATPRFCLCRHYPSPAIWAHALLVLALRSLDLRSFNTPLLPWLIRPTSLTSHSSLGLTLLPIPVPVSPRPTRERLDSEITLSPPAVLTDWVPSLSTPSVFLVCFDAVSWRSLPLWLPRRYHPPCYIISAYLPGLHSARPLAFVEGTGFEPAMSYAFLPPIRGI